MQIVAFLGGLMGFAVSFASIWCMSRTSATIYSLTGSMNKVRIKM
jgi:GDP-mannose transporter